jgi:hypothetical protein
MQMDYVRSRSILVLGRSPLRPSMIYSRPLPREAIEHRFSFGLAKRTQPLCKVTAALIGLSLCVTGETGDACPLLHLWLLPAPRSPHLQPFALRRLEIPRVFPCLSVPPYRRIRLYSSDPHSKFKPSYKLSLRGLTIYTQVSFIRPLCFMSGRRHSKLFRRRGKK